MDHAIGRLGSAGADVAVNAHHRWTDMAAHLRGQAHLSVEPEALGTAGALGYLRSWIDERPVLVTNGDAWLPVDLAPFVEGWDGERVRLLCVRDPARGDFGELRYCGASLFPWRAVVVLEAVPSGLYELAWRARGEAGELDLVVHDGEFVDCATPADYLAANMLASSGSSVLGHGAQIGRGAVIERSVVWPGAEVAPREVLVDAIRAAHLTVLVR